ncbi:MAG TPA: response regulator, partial [Thermoanaerobaculia bacterium]|nr:response regulator [Thermoanaerobaculia bacterium]
MTLEAEGFTVLEAEDGATALSLAPRGPALVIQDLILPDTDGLDLLARLRSSPGAAALPALVISGLRSRRAEIEQMQTGPTAFLPKPVEPEQLIHAVRTLLQPAWQGAARVGAGRRLLVVDDDRLNRKLAERRFVAAGFSVVTAANGQEALALARLNAPDVVLSDILMPGIDGFRLCGALQALPGLERLPVVLLSSALLEAQHDELARSMGAHGLALRTPGLELAVEAVIAALAAPARPPAAPPSPPSDDLLHEALGREVARYNVMNQRAAVHAAAASLTAGLYRAVDDSETLPQALGDILMHCLDAAGLPHGALYVEEGTATPHLASQCGLDAEQARAVGAELFRSEGVRPRLDAGTPLAIDSVGEGSWGEALARLGARSGLLVPFAAGGRRYGTLLLVADTRELVDPGWLTFARTLGAQFGQAVALGQALSRKAASERELRRLFERVPVGLYRSERDGCMLAANAPLARMLGYESGDQLVGLPEGGLWFDLAEHEAWIALCDHEDEVHRFEARLRHRDGRPVPVRLTARAERDATGSLRRWEGAVEDVTAEKAARLGLEAAQRQLERAVASSPAVLY